MNEAKRSKDTDPVLQIRQSVHIERDIEAVYRLVANRAETPTWNEMILSSTRIDGEDGASGSRYREIGRIGPLRVQYTTTILEAIPPTRFAADSNSSRVTLCWGFNLQPEGTGTRLDLWSDVLRLRGFIRFLRPAMAKMMPRGAAANLERIRILLETRTGATQLGIGSAQVTPH